MFRQMSSFLILSWKLSFPFVEFKMLFWFSICRYSFIPLGKVSSTCYNFVLRLDFNKRLDQLQNWYHAETVCLNFNRKQRTSRRESHRDIGRRNHDTIGKIEFLAISYRYRWCSIIIYFVEQLSSWFGYYDQQLGKSHPYLKITINFSGTRPFFNLQNSSEQFTINFIKYVLWAVCFYCWVEIQSRPQTVKE